MFSTQSLFISQMAHSLFLFVSFISPFEKIMGKVSFGRLTSTHCEKTAKITYTDMCTLLHTHKRTHWLTNMQLNDITVLFILCRHNDRATLFFPFSLFFFPLFYSLYTNTHTHTDSWSPLQNKVWTYFWNFVVLSHEEHTSLHGFMAEYCSVVEQVGSNTCYYCVHIQYINEASWNN